MVLRALRQGLRCRCHRGLEFEHWDAVRFFLRLPTQWRYGMSGRTGLDYTAVMSLLVRCACRQTKPADLESVQVMEIMRA